MFPIRQLRIISPLLVLLIGCGGGGGTGSADAPSPPRTTTTLASSDSGGFDALFLSEGILFFADYNTGAIFRVSRDGGDVTCLRGGWYSFSAPGHLFSAAGKVFVLNTMTSGGLSSIPDATEGITSLGGINGLKLDTIAYLDRVFWSEGSTVFSASVTLKSVDTTRTFFQGEQGAVVRISIDGGTLFVSESPGGRISQVDINTGNVITLASTLGASGVLGGIPLVVTNRYLYAFENNRNVYQIDKSSGTVTLIASNYAIKYYGGIRSDANGVYWWEPDSGNIVLHRYNDLSVGIENLVSIPPDSNYLQADTFKFLCDGNYVYWITSTSGIDVFRVSTTVTGGTPEQVVSLAPPVSDLWPGFFAADNTDFYWTSRSKNALIRLPKSGGSPTIVTQSLQGGSIAFLDNIIFMGDIGSVLRIPKQGQPIPMSEWSQPYNSTSMPMEAAFDGNTIFWAVQNFSTSGHPQTDFDLYSKPSAGGPVQFLANLPGNVVRLFPFADNLFLIRDNSIAGGFPTGSVISTLSKNGGTDLPLIQIQDAVPSDLVFRNDKLYMAVPGNGIIAFDLGRGKFDLLVPSYYVDQLYIDESHIYWTEHIAASGSVWRISLAGGSAESLYNGLPCYRITGDDRQIYWTAGWKLLSTVK